MRNKNLLVFYYDGVIGDTNGLQSFNNMRLRAGACAGLHKLHQLF